MVGAVNETLASASPVATETAVGALGTVDGLTADDAVEERDVPMPFVAFTWKVYSAPFVKPLITHDVAGATEVQVPAGLLFESKAVVV